MAMLALLLGLAMSCGVSDTPLSMSEDSPTTADTPRYAVDTSLQPILPAPRPAGLAKHVGGKHVLLYHSDGPSGASFLKSQLVATGQLTAPEIDIYRMTTTPLSLSNMLEYHCLIVWTNSSPPNPVGQGNRLKEFVDAGGTVAILTYGYSSPTSPWELQGGIMSDGYSPLDLTTTRLSYYAFPRSLDFGTALTGHPILNGVTDFTYGGNSNYVKVTLDPGATLVGSDSFGVPLIAVSASGNVVGINLYPGNVFIKSPGVFRAIANVCGGTIAVDVDIKPDGEPNSINLKSKGVIPVAILTTGDFDATRVDGATVVFEGASPAHGSGHVEDVDGDGDLDWVGHFRTQETGLTGVSTDGSLTGQTTDGQDLEGSDSVRITPGSSKGK